MAEYTDKVYDGLKKKYYWENEFLQAAKEVLDSLSPFLEDYPRYKWAKILERLVEPERTIIFRVPWVDDKGEVQVNTGYRVEFNSAIGPYKGGLRFHPSVNLGILKFLGFEQIFKNSLTGLPMGGGKGGSDFEPKGKSDNEVMTFCQSFMSELFRHIGATRDVPAGDIGVGGREIGYLFGQYKKLQNTFEGVLTGKGLNWGGSLIRPEATGYGAVYFADELLKEHNDSIEGKQISVSGFGNVAWGVCIKATELGAKVVTVSGPDGYIFDEDGISTQEKWDFLLEIRGSNNDIVKPYSKKFGVPFFEGKKPWEVKVDIAFPCAFQNELNEEDAETLIKSEVKYVIETSNMGCTSEAVNKFIENKIPFGPGKAANAGGVAVSGLEMSQNSMKYSWAADDVDDKLRRIMKDIHKSCVKEGKQEDGYINYVDGANIAGFKKVADAMLDQGVV
ncbi:MAG: NADP-specific glutamate dehydrogenase [Spirochaetes bacterium]|nr:MAG: NADP-specific glutamate dehydrogenase [Spirochaetota bacterium]